MLSEDRGGVFRVARGGQGRARVNIHGAARVEYSEYGGIHRIDGRSTGVLPESLPTLGIGATVGMPKYLILVVSEAGQRWPCCEVAITMPTTRNMPMTPITNAIRTMSTGNAVRNRDAAVVGYVVHFRFPFTGTPSTPKATGSTSTQPKAIGPTSAW